MNYFIIVRGPLGIGKTTISKKLTSILNAKYVAIDSVLMKHGLDKIDNGHIPLSNFIRADNIILPELGKKRIVIFDGCFYHKEHIDHIIQILQCPHIVFSLKAPLEVCIERDRNRKKTYGKDAVEAVYHLVSRFDYGINIDLSGSIDQGIKEIITKLPRNY